MKLELETPISAGQRATIRVNGNSEFGYLMVKLNNAYVTALTEDNGVPSLRSPVFGPSSGQDYNVWTSPEWKAHDSVLFELYDRATNTLQDSKGTVIL
jgi:hypothetical protein